MPKRQQPHFEHHRREVRRNRRRLVTLVVISGLAIFPLTAAAGFVVDRYNQALIPSSVSVSELNAELASVNARSAMNGASGKVLGDVTPPDTTASDPKTDTQPPTAPSQLQALVSGSNAIVALSWAPSSDEGGMGSYQIERSTDQKRWIVVQAGVTDNHYIDNSVAFSEKYYYRVRASDAAGNNSDYAYAEAKTASYTNNSDASGSKTYTSLDGLVSVLVKAGTIDSGANCSVEALDAPKSTAKLTVVMGAYQFVCKDKLGVVIGPLKSPISWSYKVSGRLKQVSRPVGATYSAKSGIGVIKGSEYDAKLSVVSFGTLASDTTLIVGSTSKIVVPWNLISLIGVAGLIILFIGAFALRRNQKNNYEHELRSKYYNI